MDKSIKGRQIGYVAPKVAPVTKKSVPVVKELPKKQPVKTVKQPEPAQKEKVYFKDSTGKVWTTLNDQVVAWISGHQYFKWNKALEDCGMKAGNASRMMKNGWKIPDDVLPKLVNILEQYGFISS